MRGLVVLTTRVPDRVEGPPGEVELLMAHHPEVLVAHPNARPTHAVARSPPSISSYPTRPAVAARDDCRAVRTQSQREKQMRIYLTSVLEDDSHPAAKPFKAAMVADGIPATSFAADDVHAEFQRLRGLGVRFTQEPVDMGAVTTAVFDDTCGNLIQIAKA